jgi:hypothetical protein
VWRSSSVFACAWAVNLGLAACAGPDPGPGDMEAAGTLVPPELLACRGDRDGRIEADELPLLPGVTARLRVHRDVDFSTAGSSRGGRPTWTVPDGGDLVDVATEPVEGAWFEADFAGATYAVATDPAAPWDEQILGVYLVDYEGVHLLGLASRRPDRPAGGLLLPYDEPATVLAFPVVLGTSWEVVARVSEGTVGGAAYVSEDTYRIAVDARGTVEAPGVVVRDALRLSVGVTIRTPARDPVERLEILWYRECVGEVARAVAPDGETGPELERVAQLRAAAF